MRCATRATVMPDGRRRSVDRPAARLQAIEGAANKFPPAVRTLAQQRTAVLRVQPDAPAAHVAAVGLAAVGLAAAANAPQDETVERSRGACDDSLSCTRSASCARPGLRGCTWRRDYVAHSARVVSRKLIGK